MDMSDLSNPGSFGFIVRDRRTVLKLSQAKLADLVGVRQSTVQRWESDQHLPDDRDVVRRLAKTLKVPLELLVVPLEEQKQEGERRPSQSEELKTRLEALENQMNEIAKALTRLEGNRRKQPNGA